MNIYDFQHTAAQIAIWAVPTIFAITSHEVMHGVVARSLGDDTAARAGRLTLNPLKHIDPFGTILLPALLLIFHLPVFGYAKPVPISYAKLRNPRRAMIAVAAAGPLTNLVLAAVSALALRLLLAHAPDSASVSFFALPLEGILCASVVINIVLAVFNLFPLPPLDGGRVMVGILPLPLARSFARLERYGLLILILLLYTDALGAVINPVINALGRILL